MLVATIPPYVSHRREIIEHPLVNGLRFNTIMPTSDSKADVLGGLVADCNRAGRGGKPLWIDLKGRQLRITKFAYLPYAYVELSRKIRVRTPTQILFKDCVATVVKVVDGNKLILEDRPPRVVGQGEPVNILDPSLEIEGYLTSDDLEWIEAARKVGVHRYMLSFAERQSDIDDVQKADPDAVGIVAKIESERGMQFARGMNRAQLSSRTASACVSLMAARDDLYINLGSLKIMSALWEIANIDDHAFVASRLLTSLEEKETPALGDLSDLRLMREIGFKRWMLCDGLCFNKAGFRRAMKLLEALPW